MCSEELSKIANLVTLAPSPYTQHTHSLALTHTQAVCPDGKITSSKFGYFITKKMAQQQFTTK